MIASAIPTQDYPHAAVYDRQIHAAIAATLAESQYGPLRKLACQVVEGVVELSGTVPSFYLKQLAQAAVLQLMPNVQVRNLVEVSHEAALLTATQCGKPPKKDGA